MSDYSLATAQAQRVSVALALQHLLECRPGFCATGTAQYLMSFDELHTHCKPLTMIQIEDIIGQPLTLRKFLPHRWKVEAYHDGQIQITIGRWPVTPKVPPRRVR